MYLIVIVERNQLKKAAQTLMGLFIVFLFVVLLFVVLLSVLLISVLLSIL